jgi:hypothetical protein
MIHYPVLIYFSIFSLIIPISAGIYRFRIINREERILLSFLTINFILAVISMWFIKNYWIDLGIWHIFILFEFLFLTSIICLWQETKNMKKLFMGIIGFYILFWFCAKFTFEPIGGIYSITVSVSQVIIVLGAGYTLFAVIGNRVQPLLSNPRFWVLLGFVFYYMGSLMPMALVGVLYSEPGEAPISLWYINWILSIFSNILFTIGFMCPQTRQLYSQQSSVSL